MIGSLLNNTQWECVCVYNIQYIVGMKWLFPSSSIYQQYTHTATERAWRHICTYHNILSIFYFQWYKIHHNSTTLGSVPPPRTTTAITLYTTTFYHTFDTFSHNIHIYSFIQMWMRWEGAGGWLVVVWR